MNPQSTIKLHTGNTMPVLGLGTWQLTDNTSGTIEEACRLGYVMIDTSRDYGTQPGVGKGIQESDVDREELYIISKVEETDDAYEATQVNLSELGLEYVDLMLIHRPPEVGTGEDLWQGLIRARGEGLAKDVGVSNYPVDMIDALSDTTGEKPTVNQIEWSPFGHSDEMLEYCRENEIVIQAYSPLTRGERLDDETLNDIAARYEKTPAQILIRWNLQLGTVPIPKANQKEHLEDNIDVFDFEISDEDMDMLRGLNENYSALGSSLQYV